MQWPDLLFWKLISSTRYFEISSWHHRNYFLYSNYQPRIDKWKYLKYFKLKNFHFTLKGGKQRHNTLNIYKKKIPIFFWMISEKFSKMIRIDILAFTQNILLAELAIIAVHTEVINFITDRINIRLHINCGLIVLKVVSIAHGYFLHWTLWYLNNFFVPLYKFCTFGKRNGSNLICMYIS